MDDQMSGSSGWQRFTHALWHNRVWLIIYVAIIVGLILGLPGIGVVPAFCLSLIVAIIAKRQGSFRDLGLHRPESWRSTLVAGLLWGTATGFLFLLIVDPALEQLTGEVINLEQLDIRGKFVPFLIWLAIGWIVGGFIEEFTFRATIISRLTAVLGNNAFGIVTALIVSSVPFGLAHGYQGLAGQLSTGLTGLIFGILYVQYKRNLWVPILAHGFNNTVGITLIYFDLDTQVKAFWFG